MCFSATASFVATGVLAGIGLKSLQVNKFASYRMLSFTPLLFAIQQATEGIVWLTIATPHSFINQTATYLFLTFAGIIWPLWGPLALFSCEKDATRRSILQALTAIGSVVASYTVWSFLTTPITARIVSSCIYYGSETSINFPTLLSLSLYLSATVIPCFVSSLRYGWLLGTSWLVALLVTLFFKYEVTTSVWCFFAAILSVLILMVIKKNQDE